MWDDELLDKVIEEIMTAEALHLIYILEDQGVEYRVVRSMYGDTKVTASVVVSDTYPIVILISTLQQGWVSKDLVLKEIQKQRARLH